MQQAARKQAVIDHAVGLLIGVYAVAPNTALPRLIVLARGHNMKVHRMAAMLVNLTVRSDVADTRTADDELGTPTH